MENRDLVAKIEAMSGEFEFKENELGLYLNYHDVVCHSTGLKVYDGSEAKILKAYNAPVVNLMIAAVCQSYLVSNRAYYFENNCLYHHYFLKYIGFKKYSIYYEKQQYRKTGTLGVSDRGEIICK